MPARPGTNYFLHQSKLVNIYLACRVGVLPFVVPSVHPPECSTDRMSVRRRTTCLAADSSGHAPLRAAVQACADTWRLESFFPARMCSLLRYVDRSIYSRL